MIPAWFLLLALLFVSNRSGGSLPNDSMSLVNSRHCGYQEKKSGNVPGPARNVSVECKFDEDSKQFYYDFSWNHPERTTAPVSSYMIQFLPTSSYRRCFNASSKDTRFALPVSREIMDAYIYDTIKYAIVTQPIKRIDGRFRKKTIQATVCPLPPQLDTLSNKTILSGGNFSFHCRFTQRANPKETMKWYFSEDKINCSAGVQLENSKHISFSADKCSLNILQAKVDHDGCYILKAYIGDAHGSETRGYLTVTVKEKRSSDILFRIGIAAGLCAGLVFAITVTLKFIFQRRSKKNPTPWTLTSPLQ